MESTKLEKEIINKRADELEKIGFVFKTSENSCWYEKEDVKMAPTLMMCAPERDWQKFITENSNPQTNQHETE